MSYLEFYLMFVLLPNLKSVSQIAGFISGFIVSVSFMVWAINSCDDGKCSREDDIKCAKAAHGIFKKSLKVFVLSVFLIVSIPTQKQMISMTAVVKVTNIESIKNLPDAAVRKIMEILKLEGKK